MATCAHMKGSFTRATSRCATSAQSPLLLFIPFVWVRSGSIRLGTLARRAAAGLAISCRRQVADPAAGRHHGNCAGTSRGSCAEGIRPCLDAACAHLPYMVPAVYVASTGRAEWRAGYRCPRNWYTAPHRRQITPPSTHSLHTAWVPAQHQQRRGLQAAQHQISKRGQKLTGCGHSCCWWGQSELQSQENDLQHASRCL